MLLNENKIADLVALMQKTYPGWANFSDSSYIIDEIEYKRKAIVRAQELLSAAELSRLLAEGRFDEIISRLNEIGQATNLLWNVVPSSGDLAILKDSKLDKQAFCRKFFALLYGPNPSQDRLDEFTNFIKNSGLPNKWTFPTYFLFMCHPETEMFIKPNATKLFLEYLGVEDIRFSRTPSGETYAAIKRLSSQLKDELRQFGPHDMVDIQSLIFINYSAIKNNVIEPARRNELLNDEQIRSLLDKFVGSEDARTWIEQRWEDHKRWNEWIDPNKLETIPDDDLKNRFLEYFNEGAGRHSFNAIYRDRIVRDINIFRKVIKFLLDESVSVKERLNEILEKDGKYHIDGFGKGLATSILMDLDPKNYATWNDRTNIGLEALDSSPQFARGDDWGTRYEKVMNVLRHIRKLKPDLRFLEIDHFLHIVSATEEGKQTISKMKLKIIRDRDFQDDKSSWIFQANPDIYDLAGALSELKQLHWRVNRYRDRIHTGDTVYLWESGSDGGIVAVGQILNKPEFFDDSEEEKKFIIQQHEADNQGPRVGVIISIQQVMASRIRRKDLLNHPLLRSLQILKQPQGTNFFLTKEEAKALGALIDDQESRYWVEKTLVADHPDRTQGPHSLGKALWSPQRSKDGKEIYKNMLEIQPGDIIFHLVDNKQIIGASIAKSKADDNFIGLPGTEWEGRPAYRISLGNYFGFPEAIKREDFLDNPQYREKLQHLLNRNKGLFFNSKFELNQGRYITRAPNELIEIWNQIYKTKTGEDLPYLRNGIRGEFDLAHGMKSLIDYIEKSGFIFEPWQIAAYVTALRTKPFVILAGITGTGKSKLPKLVAEATGGESILIPVKPDWIDSADVLGYSDLQGKFRPGEVLKVARKAMQQSGNYWVCILDEMNLARVEQYFAEVLSKIEDRHPSAQGGFASEHLLNLPLSDENEEWHSIIFPPNLALVGTVNMDESSHGFSRKVLDRAFTLELSDVDLTIFKPPSSEMEPHSINPLKWPVEAWFPRAIRLGDLQDITQEEESQIHRVINALTAINSSLNQAQLQIGYRTRDEIALFLINALQLHPYFTTRSGERVDPLDLALQMKVLPRIIGGSTAIRRAVMQMLGWARDGKPLIQENEATEILTEWDNAGRLGALPGSQYPRTAARLCLMWERLRSEGFTSFWI